MSSKLLAGLFCAVAVATTHASFVHAQASEKAAAESLFQSGTELMDRGQLPEACEKLEASQRLDPAVGTLLYLGDCYEQMGKTASAWATFSEAASLAQVGAQTNRHEIASTRANALESQLSYVALQVPTEHHVSGLAIELAGVAVPRVSWGAPIPVDPGEQSVRVSAPGHRLWVATITVESGSSSLSITIPRLEAVPTLPAGPSAAPFSAQEVLGRDTGAKQRIAGIIVGSIGLGGVALGAALGLQAMEENDASLERCRPDDPTLCSQEGIVIREQAAQYATGSTIAFIAGGGLAVTGLVVLLTAPSAEAREAIQRVRPLAGPGVGGLAFGGAW